MTTDPEHVTIDMAELPADEVDGRKKQNGNHPHYRSDSGHHNHSYHHHSSGSERDTEDDVEDEKEDGRHSHRRHHRHRSRSRSHSGDRHHHSPSERTKRAVAEPPKRSPRSGRDLQSAIDDAEPLLITNNKPVTKSEFDDDLPDESVPNTVGHHPGVDDGFFSGPPTSPESNKPEVDTRIGDTDTNVLHKRNPNGFPIPRPLLPVPTAPGLNPGVILDANGNPQVIPDINVYQQKKNLAQGMMDLALLSANANQLRYVIESGARHPYYWFSFVTISISLLLQIAVGVGLILNSRYNVKDEQEICRADKINNATVIGIFLVTIVNVFIAAFGVAESA